MPPLLPTVRDRMAPLKHHLAPLHEQGAETLDTLAARCQQDLTVDAREPTLDEVAAEGVQDLTVDRPDLPPPA